MPLQNYHGTWGAEGTVLAPYSLVQGADAKFTLTLNITPDNFKNELVGEFFEKASITESMITPVKDNSAYSTIIKNYIITIPKIVAVSYETGNILKIRLVGDTSASPWRQLPGTWTKTSGGGARRKRNRNQTRIKRKQARRTKRKI